MVAGIDRCLECVRWGRSCDGSGVPFSARGFSFWSVFFFVEDANSGSGAYHKGDSFSWLEGGGWRGASGGVAAAGYWSLEPAEAFSFLEEGASWEGGYYGEPGF